jgi:hypothetical protein
LVRGVYGPSTDDWTLIPEKTPFEDNSQTNQKHKHRHLVDGVHGPEVETSGTGRVFFPEEISKHFVEFKKLTQATPLPAGRSGRIIHTTVLR